MEFKIGDRVRIVNPPGGDNAGKISTIVKIYKNSSGETVYTLDYQNADLDCLSWTAKYLEKHPFDVGDLVKYKNGNTIYEVVNANIPLRLKALNEKYDLGETNPDKLIKLKFKIGDKVESLKPKFKGIGGIIGALVHDSDIVYRVTGFFGILFRESELKQPEIIPAYHEGDLVYIDPDKVDSKVNCYKLYTVLGEDNNPISLECAYNKEIVRLDKAVIKKPVFSNNQSIIIRTEYWIIKDIYFSAAKSLCYTVHNSEMGLRSYTEDELLLLQKIAKDSCKLSCGLEDNNVITSKNLLNNDKNQLQKEGTSEQSGCFERGHRFYGRKPKFTIKIGHLSFQKISCRSKE